ncbi:YaeQ family protein, partial [Leptospira sp. SA-E8]|uniref:YaeQ family protein n=1 Tax=Leptospira sp. SA-E8 TaxID=3422259 RepID=UPI003EBFF90D
VEVGQPEDKPLAKACNKADVALVYAYGHAAEVWWRGIENKLSRLDKLQVWRIPTNAAQELATLAERSMQLQATIQDGLLMLGNSQRQVEVEPLRWK